MQLLINKDFKSTPNTTRQINRIFKIKYSHECNSVTRQRLMRKSNAIARLMMILVSVNPYSKKENEYKNGFTMPRTIFSQAFVTFILVLFILV